MTSEQSNPRLSERRRRAISPHLEGNKWAVFESHKEFSTSYKGEWLTGEIRFDGFPVDISVSPSRESQRLAVVFNSQQKEDGELRLFTWQNAAKKLNCSRLHIADPTLNYSETATIGWYSGTPEFNAQQAVSQIIDSVVRILNVKECIFLGSSGGGFPAAYEASNRSNSAALLLAPTLNIRESAQAAATKAFVAEIHQKQSIYEIAETTPEVCWDLRDRYPAGALGKTGEVNLHIMQSAGDTDFWNRQTKPFMEHLGFAFNSTPEYVSWNGGSAVFGNWGSRHTPPPLSELNKALESIRRHPEGELSTFRLPQISSNLSDINP